MLADHSYKIEYLANSLLNNYVWNGIAILAVYTIYGAVWRLYFSPVAHIPGPRMAAMTSLYEAYYNNWLGGKYIWKINELHDKYGPIVRISPNVLHVGDPEFYDVLYPSTTSKRKADKEPHLTKFFGLDDSLFSTMDHDTHRMRRNALLPFFSPSMIRKLQPLFQERLDVLLKRMADLKDTDEPINANCVFAALTNDITHTIAFGQCMHKLETPNFDSSERDASLSGTQSFHLLKRLPWLNNLMMLMPESLASWMSPSLGSYMRQKRSSIQHVTRLATASENEWSDNISVPLFRTVLESPKLPPHEKEIKRVAQDAQMLMMAGTLTMASSMEHMIYWMVANPDVLQKVKQELVEVMPSIDEVGKIALPQLENLPYLTATIKEGVRLIYGNSTPHFRVNPEESLIYRDGSTGKDWLIPPKTSVGMTSVLLHHNETNFPDSRKFKPERWLGEEGKKLDKYMVGFGKGSRICLGMNQGWGVIRLAMAQIWRLYATDGAKIGDEVGVLRLFNTTPHDVKVKGDFFIAAYNKARGVEFKLTST